MGRAPCCDKANVKKGPWSPEEDAKLKSYIEQHGTGGNWIALPQKIGLKRCGKSCRLRWLNYLRPNIKHGGFSEEEDNIICSLYVSIGSRWSVIATQLPGRTDNDIKNYWNTRLKKKLLGKHRKEQAAHNRGNSSVKQESKRGSGDSLSFVPDHRISTQQLYLPQMPVLPPPLPYTNQFQGPCFNDLDSIRKLLIKLGGRFFEDYHPTLDGLNLQFPQDGPSSTQQIYGEQVHMNAINNSQVQFPHADEYCAEAAAKLELVQGQGIGFTAAIEEMVSTTSTYPQRLDGLEFFYGEDMMINDKIIGPPPTCGRSNWGTEISPLNYPPLVASNFQVVRQETPQECDFQELSYPGAQ